MDDIAGLLYLHNQAGRALAQANAEVQRLMEENAELKAKLEKVNDPVDKPA